MDGKIRAGSRRRELSLEKDNQGFYASVLQDERIEQYLQKYPSHRLYGEWLVPHTLKTYRDNAWRKFYVFDVCVDKEDGSVEYIPYNVYQPFLEEFNLDYIPPIAKVVNGTYEQFVKLLERNNFLIEDGKGIGEGIIIKNYSFYNQYGRQVWAKIITSEFSEKHSKEMGCPKEFAKIVNEEGGWSSQNIPMLLGRVFSELVKEEIWNIVKKYKYPKIDFKTLKSLVINKIKETKQEVFC